MTVAAVAWGSEKKMVVNVCFHISGKVGTERVLYFEILGFRRIDTGRSGLDSLYPVLFSPVSCAFLTTLLVRFWQYVLFVQTSTKYS